MSKNILIFFLLLQSNYLWKNSQKALSTRTTSWSISLYVSLYFIRRSLIDQYGLYDIPGNNFGFRFPGAPFPATTKLFPNSDSCFHGLFSHICHSGSMLIQTPGEDVFLEDICQECQPGEIGGFWDLYLSYSLNVFICSHRICRLTVSWRVTTC